MRSVPASLKRRSLKGAGTGRLEELVSWSSHAVCTAQLEIGQAILICVTERARSLSPQKNFSPASKSSYAGSPTQSQQIDPPIDLHPHPESEQRATPRLNDTLKRMADNGPEPERAQPPSPTKASSPTRAAGASGTALSRSGTLSWQQRPSSRDANSVKPQSLSGLATERSRPGTPSQSRIGQKEEPTRSDIAQSLASKDPTWFRQTADRGATSAAYRRTEVQDQPQDDRSFPSGSMRLPGMSRESTAEPEKSPSSRPTSRDNHSQISSRSGERFSSYSSNSTTAMPLPSSHRLLPSTSEAADNLPQLNPDHGIAQGHSGRASPERPTSPTKGLGGFVQSAMMKRSDSVSKRWSAQAGPGLQRADSIRSTRHVLGSITPVPLTRGGSPPRETPLSMGPPSSPSSSSRPTSSHSKSTKSIVLQKPPDASSSNLSDAAARVSSQDRAPENSTILETGMIGAVSNNKSGQETARPASPNTGLPKSPSKTMDPKRWSPTKASWLESALSKPESPKIPSPKLEEPSWKANLHRSKPSASSFEVVTQPGFLRSPPLGGPTKPPSIGGLPDGFSSGIVKKHSYPAPREEATEEKASDGGRNLYVGTKDPTSQAPAVEQRKDEPRERLKKKQEEQKQESSLTLVKSAPADIATKKEPPVLKPKPHTPPKTDFRANLKPRRTESQDNASSEPEFKNVFGKLRRTETKNYVAPDELKDNIVRGKGALSQTGGPQKTKRVDEFKESILSQKEAMKAGRGSIDKMPEIKKHSSGALQKPEATVPEALARRNMLTKSSGTIKEKPAATAAKPASGKPTTKIAEPLREQTAEPGKAMTGSIASPVDNDATLLPLKSDSTTAIIEKGLEPDKTTDTAEMMQKPSRTSASLPDPPTQEAISSKLAGRLNPALASILRRGPPSAPGSANASQEDLSIVAQVQSRSVSSEPSSKASGELSHITKGRAKGPKRRTPKATAGPQAVVESTSTSATTRFLAVDQSKRTAVRADEESEPVVASKAPASETTSTNITPRPLATLINQNARVPQPESATPTKPASETVSTEVTEKLRPVAPKKSPDLSRKVSLSQPEKESLELKNAPPKTEKARPVSPLLTRKPSLRGGDGESRGAPKASTWKIGDPTGELQARAPVKSPAIIKESAKPPTREPSTTTPVPRPLNGLGLSLDAPKFASGAVPSPGSTPPVERSFPKRVAVDPSSPRKLSPMKAARPGPSSSKGPSPAEVMEVFFDERPKIREKTELDTNAVISAAPDSAAKTRTLKMEIWEVNGDGKRSEMPPQQKHILFEDCMYLCVHWFENGRSSKSTEAYLWCGDSVGEAALEDAQLFCRKIARENSAKLEVVKQGKEEASLIEALGGIIITRKSKSSSLYMLCGRRHLGHISFDEVDLDAKNLCSGFPYIVSARFGKLYLWKGQGSSADELGCARLIGMDLGLTGEIEEVDEGKEPAQFWETLSASKGHQMPSVSEQWAQKGKHDQYACRLYRVQAEQPKSMSFWGRRGSSPAKPTVQVQEITPFCQQDIEASHVYVLDAYFEIYV